MGHGAQSVRRCTGRRAFALIFRVGGACALLGSTAACSNHEGVTGRRILADLEARHVEIPDDDGRAASRSEARRLPESGPITLADLLAAAEATNPELAGARSEVGIAAGRAWQASLYPNPYVDVFVEDVSWNDGLDGAKETVGVTQPIVLGGRLDRAREAANAERLARLADAEATRRAVFGEVAILYARLITMREQARIYAELQQLADRTLDAAQTRFDARAATETDVIRPRLEARRMLASSRRLEQEERVVARQLGLLVGDADLDPSRVEGSLDARHAEIDEVRLQASVRTSHPSLVAADREIDASASRLELVRAEKVPDLDVRLAAGYEGQDDSGIVEFGAGMTVPLWDSGQGRDLSARFELMRARQARAALETSILSQLAEAVGEYDAARAELDAFREQIVPDAVRAYELAGEGYRGGRTSFLELLDSQRTLTEARVTLVELEGDVAAARAKVVQIVGPEALLDPADAGSHASSVQEVPVTSGIRPQGEEDVP